MTLLTLGLLDLSVCALFAVNPVWTPLGRATRIPKLDNEIQPGSQMTRPRAATEKDSRAGKTGSTSTEPERDDRK